MTWPAIAVFVAALAGQSFWIAHALTGLRSEMQDLRADVRAIKDDGLRSLGERIARLEAHQN